MYYFIMYINAYLQLKIPHKYMKIRSLANMKNST